MAKRTGHISVRLPPEITEAIARIMERETRNKSNAVEHLLRIALASELSQPQVTGGTIAMPPVIAA